MIHLIIDRDRGLVPSYDISFINTDTFEVIVYTDIDKTDRIYVTSDRIYSVNEYELVKYLVQSMDIRNLIGSTKRIFATSIEGKKERWDISYGAVHNSDEFVTQFIFPENILLYDEFIFMKDPSTSMNRVLVRPKEGIRRIKTHTRLTPLHQEIIDVLRECGPSTTNNISELLDRPESSISGRMSELARMGRVMIYDYDYSSGYKRTLWHVDFKVQNEGCYDEI